MARSAADIQDELLVVRCRRGDHAAWNELVELWNGRLLYYLRRLLDDEDAVGNTLQDVWLKVLRGISSLRHNERLAPWLYAIARNTAMSHYRSLYKTDEKFNAVDVAQINEDGDSELHLENAELVHFGLARLDLAEREVLTLFFLDDLSTAEIGQLLDVPQGTVKSRLFKARGDLRRVIQREVNRHER